MAKYLVTANYSSEGIKAVLKSGGTSRSDAVRSAIEDLGGTMESFHFAFGDTDAFVIIEMPDNVSTAALALAVSSTGLAAVRVIVLLTPAEIDDAAKRQVHYTPPGS